MGNIKTAFGKKIKELRKRNGYTQAQLAELVDMDITNICKLELGSQFPKEENIEKLANVLHVNVSEMFDFGIKRTKDELEKEVIRLVKCLSQEDLERFYKIILAIID